MAFFNSNPGTGASNLVDQTDAYANKFLTNISFLHIPSNNRLFFKAMITTFSDSFTSQWSGEEVYGRADPIQIFKSTKRSITLGFDVVASTDYESWQNLSRLQTLAQFLYPAYTGVEAQTIAQAPLVRVGFMNMITDNNANLAGFEPDRVKFVSMKEGGDGTKVPTQYDNAAQNGLVCAITSLNYSSFGFEKDNSNSVVGKGSIIPRVINVSLSLEPIHRHQLGWQGHGFAPIPDETMVGKTSIARNYAFPYGEVAPDGVHKGNSKGGRDATAGVIDREKYDDILNKATGIKGYGMHTENPRPSAATLTKAAAYGVDTLLFDKNVINTPDGSRNIGIDTSNISSGMDFLNNPTDPDNPGVIQTLNQRQLKQQGAQQQIDMANARYHSLGGQLRYNRDERLTEGRGLATKGQRDRARASQDAYNNQEQTLSDFDQPIDVGSSPNRGAYD